MAESNAVLESEFAEYDKACTDYVQALKERGIKFADAHSSDEEIAKLREELRKRGADFRNAGASISTGWLSKACVECTGNKGSETFSITLKCHRDCYFCFNHNLEDYQTYFDGACPWQEGLDDAKRMFGDLAVIGLTGGEPLLNVDDAVAFLERAGELFPTAHKRMYTSGDLLTEEAAARLHDAGLDEIRFSVKHEDTDELQERVLSNMAMAGRFIPDVMVEMPIIPGNEERMRYLLRRFAEAGIKGINLLEFCFPFHAWEEFDKRGFVVRNPPFAPMYDYSYTGGLPIAGSEELCLRLMLFGMDEGLPFGMHYCSLENKHRSEMRQMNECAKGLHPCFEFDEGDFFLKTAKVFGDDCATARSLLSAAGCTSFIESPDGQALCFPLSYAKALRGTHVEPVCSINVLETDEQGRGIREIGLERL